MSGIISCMKETNSKAQELFQAGDKGRAKTLMGWYKAALKEIADLDADQKRLDGYFALIESTGVAQPVFYNSETDRWKGVGWYYALQPRAFHYDGGPFDTRNEAIDAAMKEVEP